MAHPEPRDSRLLLCRSYNLGHSRSIRFCKPWMTQESVQKLEMEVVRIHTDLKKCAHDRWIWHIVMIYHEIPVIYLWYTCNIPVILWYPHWNTWWLYHVTTIICDLSPRSTSRGVVLCHQPKELWACLQGKPSVIKHLQTWLAEIPEDV